MAKYQGKIETSIFASQPQIKMERMSSEPSRALLSQFLSGDKCFVYHLGSGISGAFTSKVFEAEMKGSKFHALNFSFVMIVPN